MIKWFTENFDTAVFTSKYVLDNSPILYVYHYEEDGAWSFLGEKTLMKKIIELFL